MTIEDLVGQKLASVSNEDDEVIRFKMEDGREFTLSHYQDCCESVSVESIDGDLADLVGEVLIAYEDTNTPDEPKEDTPESFTWTFYRIGTVKGTVVIRWYGTSNGYYSESVSFNEVTRRS